MSLNKKGIRQVADLLVAQKERYNQNTFGKYVESCGTVHCLAGIARAIEVGVRKHNTEAKGWSQAHEGINVCLPAGEALLGVPGKNEDETLSQIFSELSDWPEDLQEIYGSNGPRARVIAALSALQRLLPDGTIDENPKAVHTRLPQLTKLLKEVKAKAKKAA